MKNILGILVVIAAGIASVSPAVGATAPAKPAPQSAPEKAAAQSGRITREIDSLLGHRTVPDPLPLVLPNPFLIITNATATRGAEGPAVASRDDTGRGVAEADSQPDPTPASSAAALARYASTLKIGGIMRMNDQLVQIVLNGVTRKEGDIISVKLDNATVRIQVARILPNELALRLGDAELTVKF